MKRVLAGLAMAVALHAAAAQEIRSFDAGSLEKIRATHAGKPFVLAFWSVTCEPCRDEMPVWNAMRKKYPDVPIELVATDPPGERAAVRRYLERYNPGDVRRWAFADDFSERVRYAVDKSWRGELPRTYFYDAAHRGEARSGVLNKQDVEAWFARQSQSRRKPATTESR
jgi:thiol-disulfide isomerase/thioredoxin